MRQAEDRATKGLTKISSWRSEGRSLFAWRYGVCELWRSSSRPASSAAGVCPGVAGVQVGRRLGGMAF